MDKVIRTIIISERDNKHVVDVYYEGSAEKFIFTKSPESSGWIRALDFANETNDQAYVATLIDLIKSVSELKKGE